jgi:hypothetical protein
MKRFFPFLLVMQLHAQTNLFRMYNQPQPQPTQKFTNANLGGMIRTADGGVLLSSNTFSANAQQQVLSDYYSVKTNSLYTPSWKKLVYLKTVSLGSGGLISINLGSKNKGLLEKHTLGGQSIWSKEIQAQPPANQAGAGSFTLLKDVIAYANKLRVLGQINLTDASGNVTSTIPFTAEFDTSACNLLSASILTIQGVQAAYTHLYRDNHGSFYFTGNPKSGIAKFSSTFTFMWNLAWQNSVFKPEVQGLRFLPNGDLFCAMQYFDTTFSYFSPGMMRISNPANVVFEKKMAYNGVFSGHENMPNANVLFSWTHKTMPGDTQRTALMAVDPDGTIVWSRIYHQSIAVSPPLSLGNGEYILHSLGPRYSAAMAQQPVVFTVDQFGNTSCGSKLLSVSLASLSSAPALNTVVATQATITVVSANANNNFGQNYKDTCGGAGIGFVSLSQREGTTPIKIGPNPCHGKINICTETDLNSPLILVQSMDGKCCKRIMPEGRECTITGLMTGVYVLTVVEQGKVVWRQKLVVQEGGEP